MIIIAIVIIVAVASGLVYNLLQEKGKEYEIEEVKQYNYFLLKQNNFYGVIDKKGNTIIPAQYSEIKIPNPEKAVFVCYQGENTQVLNERKEPILTEYNQINPIRLKNISSDLMYEKSVLTYGKDGKKGLISLAGKEIAKPVYDEIESLPYKEGALIVKQNGKSGIINIKGNSLVETKYDEVKVDEYYTEEEGYRYAGYIVLQKTQEGYRYGYINHKGKEILPAEYNEMTRVTGIYDNDSAYLICAKNGQYGLMKKEETILNHEYQSIQYDEANGVFVVEKSRKYGIVNKEGEEIVPAKYNEIDITGIYFYAKNEQGTTVYHSNGTQANIDANIAILNTDNEKYKIRIDNTEGTKYGVINKEGKQLIEEKYNYIEYLYDNYFIVSDENGKLGVLDDKGRTKVETNHDSLQKIQDTDLLQATLGESQITEIYNKTMEKICEMPNATIVAEEYIKIYNEEEEKYFNKDGKELKNTEVYSSNKLFVAKKHDKYGFVDKNGNVVVDYQYDKAYEFNKYGVATVKKDERWGAINEQGQEIVAPSYEIKDQTEPSFIGKYYQVTYGFGEIYYTDDAK